MLRDTGLPRAGCREGNPTLLLSAACVRLACRHHMAHTSDAKRVISVPGTSTTHEGVEHAVVFGVSLALLTKFAEEKDIPVSERAIAN